MSKLQVKMDARYKGYPQWEYFIPRLRRTSNNAPTLYDSMQIFFQWREWCWSTWGPSKEISNWLDDSIGRVGPAPVSQNKHWCWSNDLTSTRIYLRTEAELTLFLLKWA